MVHWHTRLQWPSQYSLAGQSRQAPEANVPDVCRRSRGGRLRGAQEPTPPCWGSSTLSANPSTAAASWRAEPADSAPATIAGPGQPGARCHWHLLVGPGPAGGPGRSLPLRDPRRPSPPTTGRPLAPSGCELRAGTGTSPRRHKTRGPRYRKCPRRRRWQAGPGHAGQPPLSEHRHSCGRE